MPTRAIIRPIATIPISRTTRPKLRASARLITCEQRATFSRRAQTTDISITAARIAVSSAAIIGAVPTVPRSRAAGSKERVLAQQAARIGSAGAVSRHAG